MGGRVGLKGTDGVVDKARQLGAQPIAQQKALEMLAEFSSFSSEYECRWYTCSGDMGERVLRRAGFTNLALCYTSKNKQTTSHDTKQACTIFLKENVDLIVFCGGDGTARDIFDVVGKKIPLLGIPSGVKMHSGVFGITTRATAKMLQEFLHHRLTIGDVEIMDLDEERYRKGEWNIRLFGVAKGIVEPTYVQVGKTTYESVSDTVIKDELAEHIEDELDTNPEVLYLFGSGGTIDYIAQHLGLDNTLLGIDAVYQKKTIATDCNEQQLLDLLQHYPKTKLIVSPIGAQGFILGRGNLQLSPPVIKKIGLDNIIVVSTPTKIVDTPLLRVDTGDASLDRQFAQHEFFMVVVGYRLRRVVKIQTNNF